MRRLADDHLIEAPQDEDDSAPAQNHETPVAPPPTPTRSFNQLDQDSWFANQPEVQRIVHDRDSFLYGDRSDEFEDEPPPDPGPYDDHLPTQRFEQLPPPERHRHREPLNGSLHVDTDRTEDPDFAFRGTFTTGHAVPPPGTYGDFTEPSPWFTEQPEFQRMRGGRAREAPRGGGILLKIASVFIGVAVVAVALWLADVGGMRQMTDLDTLRSLPRLVADNAENSPEPSPLSDPAPIDQTPPPVAGSAATKQQGRAPTALGAAAPQTDGVTVLPKSPPPPERQSRGVTAPIATEGAIEAANSPRPVGDGIANQSVFAPTQRALPEPSPQIPSSAAEPATANPFESFSGGASPAAEPASGQSGSAQPASLSGSDLGLESIDRAVAIEAGEIDAYVAEARTLFVGRDFDGAAKLLRDVLASDPGNIPALQLYGDILTRNRQPAPALEIFDAILAVDPTDTRALINRGTALLALGQPAAAAEAAGAALSLSPDSIGAVSLLSKAHAASGAMPEAMTGCERVGTLSASKSEIEWCRAAAQNQAGNHFVAVRMFITALNTGEQGLVRSKQVFLRDLDLYDGPVDGVSNQSLIDAVTACAVAKECIL